MFRPQDEWEESDDWDESTDDDVDAEPDDSEGEPTVPCPACGRDMLEDCDHCPACGHWRNDDEEKPTPRPAWVVATAVACLAVALWWALRRS